MAKRDFLADIDLNKNQMLNMKLQNLSTAPTLKASDVGFEYFNTTDKKAYIWDGVDWNDSFYVHPNHTGDVSSTGDGATVINTGVVTNAKLATVATATFKGRTSAGSGAPEDLTITQSKVLLSIDQVNNTSDANKPVSTATQTALNLKANIASPTFTETVTAPILKVTTGAVVGEMLVADSTGLLSYSPAIVVSGATGTGKVIIDRDLVVNGNITASKDVVAFVAGAVTSTVLSTLTASYPLSKSSAGVASDSNIEFLYDTSQFQLVSNKLSIIPSVIAPAVHTHYQLYNPAGTVAPVYVDASNQLHIDGNIIQNGASYETHAEQVFTKDDYIILRDGATAGLTAGTYAGFTAKKYDGVNDGHLVFDNNGVARVGDVGTEQAICTRIETPTNGYFPFWDSTNLRLNFKTLVNTDITDFQSAVTANTSVAASATARHNAVTIATANGLSLSTQALSLSTVTTSANGAMLATDKTKLDGIGALATVRKYSVNIGNGTGTTFAVTHSLGADVIVQCRYTATNTVCEPEIVLTSATVATINFNVAPATNSIDVVVLG